MKGPRPKQSFRSWLVLTMIDLEEQIGHLAKAIVDLQKKMENIKIPEGKRKHEFQEVA